MTDTHDNNSTDPTDRSPCLTCERKDLDKTVCSIICPRLATYRSGEPWQDVEIVKIAKETKASKVKEQKSEIKEAKEACRIKDCPEDEKIRGLCGPHYTRWIGGYILHPELGKFVRKYETSLAVPNSKIEPIKIILPAPKEKAPKTNNLVEMKSQIIKLQEAVKAEGAKKVTLMGLKIKNRREKLGMPQEELGVYIRISRAQLANIEGGISSTGVKTLINICDALETTPNELLGY